jgi:hypothetical protein
MSGEEWTPDELEALAMAAYQRRPVQCLAVTRQFVHMNGEL